MALLNSLKYGFTCCKTVCTRSYTLYIRQWYILGYGTNKSLSDGLRFQSSLFRCFATKARVRPRLRTDEDEKKKKTGNRLRTFFITIFPQTVALIIAIVVIVFAMGLVSSVKESAKLYYSKSRLGVYKDTLNRCSQDTEVIRLLGEPIKEVMVNGKPEKVQITETTVDNVQHVKMQFNLIGPRNTGTVHLQGTKVEEEDFQVVYLCVNVGEKTIIIEDNR